MPQNLALGIEQPQINTVQNFQASQTNAINQRGAQMQQEAAALQQMAELGLGVMGGKLDGPIDPQRLDQALTLLGNSPLAQHVKDNPELLRTITHGSLGVLQYSQDQQKFEMAKQQFDLELQKAATDAQKAPFIEVSRGATLHDVTGQTPDFTAPMDSAGQSDTPAGRASIAQSIPGLTPVDMKTFIETGTLPDSQALAWVKQNAPQYYDAVRTGVIKAADAFKNAVQDYRAKTFRTMTPEEVAKAGLPPGPYQMDSTGKIMPISSGGGVTVNNVGPDGKIGQVPAGYVLQADPKSPAGYVMVPVPGGPADTTGSDAAKKQLASSNGDVVTTDINRALQKIIDNPTMTTGPVAQLTGGIGVSPAGSLQSLIKTISTNVGMDRLQQMREASKTGGALGNVSDSENKMLQAALGDLDTSISADQLQFNLKRVFNIYKDIVDGPGVGERYDIPDAPMVGKTTGTPKPDKASGPIDLGNGVTIEEIP